MSVHPLHYMDPVDWCNSLPDRAPTRTDRPEPPDCPGWTIDMTASTARANTWRIVARRSYQVVVADKLTASEVEAFDATERWNRP